MPNLKELLESLDIDLEDDNDNNQDDKDKKTDIKLEDIKLDEIPEAQRPIFQTLINTVEETKNSLAERDLVIKTLKENRQPVIDTQKKTEDKKTDDEETDPYLKEIKSLRQEIHDLRNSSSVNKEDKFFDDVKSFAVNHRDIARYVHVMDGLRSELSENSKMKYDVEKLYKTAKAMSKGKEDNVNNKREDLNRNANASRFVTESSGMSSGNVREISSAKSINDAFELAEKQVNKR